ncbi:MAG: hypothetical protein E7327_02180 [Clostridiales bacterium]|nr:hypothetical protein [Clostridiales bacterium]
MDRILILMAAEEYADAQPALTSAMNAAAAPDALSWGLTLTAEPDEDSMAAMQALGMVHFLCPAADLWQCMPALWHGESYVLMAHPAMRFTKGWDRELLRELRACPSGQVLTCALTGYLPVREDPLTSVCPVAADAFTQEDELTFHHGMPLRFAAGPTRGPFLHPDFCFAPAGFFRALAEGDEPLFMRAFRHGWDLYTLHRPIIRLLWDVPVEPCRIAPTHDLQEDFASVFGVSFASRLLSAPARRGMLSEDVKLRMRVPVSVKVRETYRQKRYAIQRKLKRHAVQLEPKCVTLYTSQMEEETLRWLKQLAALKNLPLVAYVEPLQVRQIAEFLPSVHEFRSRHAMELPVEGLDGLEKLSKAALLSTARDKYLTPSHYIWMDADAIRYPVYDRAFFDWQAICTDRIVMAMVNGVPDTTMFCVPEKLVLPLARDLQARTLTIIEQRGSLPEEHELWDLVIRENPDWFNLVVLPVKGQLFTLVCEN